jgi:uncharacterized iron-regulated protein
MKPLARFLPLVVLAACSRPAPVAPLAFALPDSTSAVDGGGARITTPELLRRIGSADIVLLGEVHDNPVDHALRGALISAFAARNPAIVFEQLTGSDSAIAPPAAGDSIEGWLDRNGFDRRGWRWPLHRPVVDAAIAHGRGLWGSFVSRERLRAVVRQGDAAAPPELRRLMERAPLDSISRAVLDQELIDGHCGQLPAAQVPGMRSAQVVRDASMARALMLAAATGPAWLIAGNGHVRRDIAVPRILRAAMPSARILSVGLLERQPNGADPAPADIRQYDLVIITPRTARANPCA